MSLLMSCAGACLLVAANAPAPATIEAVEPQTVGEIVVLGRRQAPRDLTLGAGPVTEAMSPSSRSIENDLIKAVGATRLADALELVSGVSQQNNRGGVMDNFAIRGFLGTPDGGAEYYVDGFLANRGMAPPRDPATAERIEVLKGPSGALFGDIDPAGRINIVSKTPRFATGAAFTATVGSFGLRRGELDLTGPINDTLAGRLVVAGETSTGWRDHVGLDRTVIAPSLTWRPNDDLRLTYVGEFTTFTTLFDRGMPAIDGDALALPESNYYGEPGDGVTRFRNERHQITGDYQISDGWSLNGGIAWRGGSLKGLSSDQSRLVGDQLWRQRRGRDFTVEDLSARLELNGVVETGLGVHNLGFGVKAYQLTYGEKWLRINPTAANPYPIDVFNPVYGAVTPPTPLPFTDNLETRKVVTLYAQDLWEVNDRLSLLAGLRLDDYDQTIRNNRTGAVGEASDTPLKYRFAARYRLTDNLTAHASYGQSFVLNSGTGRDGSGFAPEDGQGYEIGLAGAWDGLDLAATVFDIEKSNILTTDPVDPNFLAPVGKLTTRGIELDGSFRIDDAWQVVANYGWTDATADDSAFATDAVLNVPEHSGSLFAIGRFATAHGTTWSVMAGAAYVGDRAGALTLNPVRLPAYWKAKAALDYGLTPQVTARIEVDNLLDERYAASSYSALWIFPGAPRSVRASLRIAL
ncbi:TonB-dependent siderophore receptor [Brevundimonas intermedia]|uniref:TonB-dependent siderophore receptor n=1 Tax=Brevundimonas intermedia TaxID=74315 RepID=A0A4Y9RX70_9CAUL|nr:TonB-dependent siderophore receptor [Brevundimonas intermedia]TFW12811.1 TonB-dependent siderophore receptor [Brevundimonas intermedia]